MAVIGLTFLGEASAHSYKSAGTVTVQFHVSPNDRPVAGTVSLLNFFIADKANKFVLADCYCRAVVQNAKGKKQTVALAAERVKGESRGAMAITNYTFAKGGVYTVELLATSKRLQGFPAFKVAFLQPVEAESPGSALLSGITSSWLIFIASLGLLGLLVVLVWGQRKPQSYLTTSDNQERFGSPLLHYGFYALLIGVALLTLFGNTVYVHHGH